MEAIKIRDKNASEKNLQQKKKKEKKIEKQNQQ